MQMEHWLNADTANQNAFGQNQANVQKQFGFGETTAPTRNASPNRKAVNADTRVEPSSIHGEGLFADKDFSAGSVIAPVYLPNQLTESGHARMDPTTGMVNSSLDANLRMSLVDGQWQLITLRAVQPGEELVATYSRDGMDGVWRGQEKD
jgi:hypothetical protein